MDEGVFTAWQGEDIQPYGHLHLRASIHLSPLGQGLRTLKRIFLLKVPKQAKIPAESLPTILFLILRNPLPFFPSKLKSQIIAVLPGTLELSSEIPVP